MAPGDVSPARDALTSDRGAASERSCANRPRAAAGARRHPQGTTGRGPRSRRLRQELDILREAARAGRRRPTGRFAVPAIPRVDRARGCRRVRTGSSSPALAPAPTTVASGSPRIWPAWSPGCMAGGCIGTSARPTSECRVTGARAWSTSRWPPRSPRSVRSSCTTIEIVGTLPYLAPEQTGRTGRPVDQRADLYALGATLYEMATGAPPFGHGDPMRLIHDHLARVPRPTRLTRRYRRACPRSSCSCWRTSLTVVTRPPTGLSTT